MSAGDAPLAETRCRVAADHPSLAGHFPGDPVVPGVVILDAVLRAVKDRFPGRRAAGLPSVKFTRPLRPGGEFAIRLREDGPGRLRFECADGEGVFVNGGIRLGT